MIRYSEYEMLDWLHKTPAWISLLSLLINLKSHRELLLKVLNDAYKKRSRPKEEPMAIKCRGYMIAKVQIDNGSLLNVMPKATLDKLYLPDATLKNNPIVVKAFDGSKWEVMGEIGLPTRIGPKTFDNTF
ncbi:hypothetical protein CR513_10546, partial [Mucuna pruriens]